MEPPRRDARNRNVIYGYILISIGLGLAVLLAGAFAIWGLFFYHPEEEMAVASPTSTFTLVPTMTPSFTPLLPPTNTPPHVPSSTPPIPSPSPQVTSISPLPSPTPTAALPSPSPTPASAAAATPTPSPSPSPSRPRPQRMNSPEYGMQAFLWWRPDTAERDLRLIKEAGFQWVKQGFAWRDIEGAKKGHFDWTQTDRIVAQVEKYGLDLVVRLDHQPWWAGGGYPTNGPPDNYEDFGDFVEALARRYKGRIRAYEIWNEPNLAREWGGRVPNAAEYVRLLKVAYQRIKAVDPGAMVITAGLTPTGSQPPDAIPDDVYLEQMYQAGIKGYYDVIGLHAPGYKAPPEMSPDEVMQNQEVYGHGRWFCFRRVEDLRAIMVKYGDADTQVAILEFGWTSDQVHPAYSWHAVTEEQKADYLVRAYQWAKEHWSPWIGLMSLVYIADPDWTPEDEQYWWAITNPDGTPRPAYLRLKEMKK